MNMPKLTKAQENAINTQNKTLLVSAAAGSGKTFTLIQRILGSVVRKEDPVSLDRLLVVTFTKDTASELKLRISAALSAAIAEDSENEQLASQITLLPSAKISTIDSFYLDLVRSNYATLDLSPNFRITDTGEEELLQREVMERLIDRCYDDPESTICGSPKGFADLVDLLVGNKDDSRLSDTLLTLYTSLSSYPEGAAAMYEASKQLYRYAEEDFFECPYGEKIKAYISSAFSHYKNAYRSAMDIMMQNPDCAATYCITFEEDYAFILDVENALRKGYSEGRNAINAIVFKTLKYPHKKKDTPDPPQEEQQKIALIKNIRAQYKKEVSKIVERFTSSSDEQIKKEILASAKVCHDLGDFLTEYECLLEAEKKRKNVCSFSDLSRYSLRLLVDENGNDTPFALEQKKLYDAIYIDEYQDVNAVQDRIFKAISTETNRFMVGDIKQSIYAFRGAEPSIFSKLRNEYPEFDKAAVSDNATIFMSENFRCNEEIIDFTNHICDILMPMISPSLHYSTEDSLVFGKKSDSKTVHPVEVVIVQNPPKGAPDENRNAEADFVADEIFKLTHGALKDDGTPITPDDIAILMSSPKGAADTYSTALRERGIPVYAETDENLLLQSEIEIVRCFMSAIDNPRRDIPLAGALLSPLCGIDCDLVAKLRGGKTDRRLITTIREFSESNDSDDAEKISAFLSKLANFRKMARYMGAGEFVDSLYAEMAIPARLGGENQFRRANLEKFRQVAYNFSSASGGTLSAFLRYLTNIENNANNLTVAKAGNETHGAVRIMSVHKSKGLEFPVVFFANTAKDYYLPDKDASPIYTGANGFGMKLRDESGFCVYDTMLRKSVSLSKEYADKEEKLRLLYVALTRARERLYVSARVDAPELLLREAEFENKLISPYLALSKCNHFKLSLLALGAAETPYVTYKTVKYAQRAASDETIEAATNEDLIANEETVYMLQNRFNYVYPHIARTKIPAKLSISRLYPDILDDVVFDTSIDDKPKPKAIAAPRFILSEDNLAAKRGTATHLFMQFFDFDYAARHGAAAELERLREKHFISDEDAALVNIDEVGSFLTSPLFAEMQSAAKLYREQRFNLHLPASEFAADKDLKEELKNETVLVQGVIDCFYYDKDGEIILVDYKTDRVPSDRKAAEDKLREAHSRQLGYYARAIEEICGKPPKAKIIFSLALGEAIIV